VFENGRISDFQGLVTLTLTLDWVILHTSTCIPNFIEIEEAFCGRTDGSYLLPTSKSRDARIRTKIKNPAPISFRYCALI